MSCHALKTPLAVSKTLGVSGISTFTSFQASSKGAGSDISFLAQEWRIMKHAFQ